MVLNFIVTEWSKYSTRTILFIQFLGWPLKTPSLFYAYLHSKQPSHLSYVTGSSTKSWGLIPRNLWLLTLLHVTVIANKNRLYTSMQYEFNTQWYFCHWSQDKLLVDIWFQLALQRFSRMHIYVLHISQDKFIFSSNFLKLNFYFLQDAISNISFGK